MVRIRVILLVSLWLVHTCATGQDDRLTVKRDPRNPTRFLCDVQIATFSSPSGWKPNRSDGNTYAILTPSDESYPMASKMISIDIGKSTTATTEETAQAFAKKWNGQVTKRSALIDGEQAYQVLIPPDKQTVRPINCVVMARDGKTVLLIGGAKQKFLGVGKALDEIAASWKWKP